jgi:hypothetical protein
LRVKNDRDKIIRVRVRVGLVFCDKIIRVRVRVGLFFKSCFRRLLCAA